MKIRTGFVSNSSSSSFIISGSKYQTTSELALAFLQDPAFRALVAEYNEADTFGTEIANLQRNPPQDLPIYLENIGGETLKIMRNPQGNYYTQQTRNVDWELAGIMGQEEEGYFSDEFEQIAKFYLPAYDLLGHQDYADWNFIRCPHCQVMTFTINGLLQCPVCRQDKTGRLDPHYVAGQREDKIARVLNDHTVNSLHSNPLV